jgi:hypothetical protein
MRRSLIWNEPLSPLKKMSLKFSYMEEFKAEAALLLRQNMP